MKTELSNPAFTFTEVSNYLKRGWHVLPLHSRGYAGKCDCGRSTCQSPAKHPLTPHGINDATSDIATVRDWIRQWPRANWGIATGSRSGLIVLDIDGPVGAASIARYKVPFSFYVTTSRGWHGYFRLPKTGNYPSLVQLLPGVDIRSEGGYIIAPPSTHISGTKYEVYCDHALALPPYWLLEIIARKNHRLPAARKEAFLQGERNSELFRRGCGFARNSGMNYRRLHAWLSATNKNRCRPPLEEKEVSTITLSILKTIRKDG